MGLSKLASLYDHSALHFSTKLETLGDRFEGAMPKRTYDRWQKDVVIPITEELQLIAAHKRRYPLPVRVYQLLR